MNISRENTGDLTATVKIEITPADYQETVDNQITDYKRKANIPGFRPGHVPTGLIKKMYGKALLADEVNRLVTKALMDFIKDENLNILGNPIPSEAKNSVVDFDNQDTFEFYFDLGFSPDFTISHDLESTVTRYSIAVSDEMVEKYILDTRKRYGKPIVNDNEDVTIEEADKKSEPETEPVEMNPEFFNMVYPGMNLQTEEAFTEQVRKDARLSFDGETDKILFNDITDALVQNTRMELPDAFLKRWLVESNEDKFTMEQIEAEYPKFVDSMKWQLIENKIIKENEIKVTDEDIKNYIRTYMFRQLNVFSEDPEMLARYESLVETLMENKEQVQRINDQLYNARLMDYFKSSMNYSTKEVSYEEFIQIAGKHHQHDHVHNHDHDHDHDHDGHQH